jgi:MoxR-like ATPase
MRAKQLKEAVKFAIKNKHPLLIKGAPGIGKTDIVTQACRETKTELIISHPVVSDPTDFKGLPFPVKGQMKATFLPFGDLLKLIDADKPTAFFLDDLGQATASVQAAAMQLLLARRINGHKVSDQVVFLAATNRRQDRAAVQGILEPVKSRFSAIVELEVVNDDWVDWAIAQQMPVELIAFIRFRPQLLHDFKPTADISNTPNPRTVAAVGKMMKSGLAHLSAKNPENSRFGFLSHYKIILFS